MQGEGGRGERERADEESHTHTHTHTHTHVRMYVCIDVLMYVGFDYTYIDINALARGIKSCLASQVWFQGAAGATETSVKRNVQ